MNKQTVHVTIFDESYSLLTDESSDHLQKAALLVNSLMKETVQAGFKDMQKVAVLAALQLASDLLKKEFSVQDHKEKYDRIVEWAQSQDKVLDTVL
jgi:cell division protein ZapA (FtsZ GTPase activity inhibitor)